MASLELQKSEHAFLTFVRQAWEAVRQKMPSNLTSAKNLAAPTTYTSLCTGFYTSFILHIVDPDRFPAMLVEAENATRVEANWIAILPRMLDYAIHVLSGPSSLSMAQICFDVEGMHSDPGTVVNQVAKSVAHLQETLERVPLNMDQVEVDSARLESDLEHQRDRRTFRAVLRLFMAIVVLSGNQDLIQVIKGLQRDDQVSLSNNARSIITNLQLKQRKPAAAPIAPAVPTSGGSTAAPPGAAKLTQDSLPTSSDPRGAPQGPAQTTASNAYSTDRAPPPPPPRDAARPAPAHAPVPQGSAPSSHTRSLLIDDSEYRASLAALENELADSKQLAMEMQSKYELECSEKAELAGKYSKLLAEMDGRGNTGRMAADPDVRRALSNKEEKIRSLTLAVDDLTSRIDAFKQATLMHEEALGLMKKKIRNTEEALKIKSDEKLEALQRLAVAQDTLEVVTNGRDKLAEEAEDLRAQLALAKACVSSAGGGPGGVGGRPVENALSTSSFSSNASLDRFAQLESEVAELRTQKDAAERHLQILQRQLTTATTTSGGPGKESAESDAKSKSGVSEEAQEIIDSLKSKIRDIEREKESLRSELCDLSETNDQLREQLASTSELLMLGGDGEDMTTGEGNDFDENDDMHSLDALSATGEHHHFQAGQHDPLDASANSNMMNVQALQYKKLQQLQHRYRASAERAKEYHKQVEELEERLKKQFEASRQEHSVLVLAATSFGLDNLLLRQRQQLERPSKAMTFSTRSLKQYIDASKGGENGALLTDRTGSSSADQYHTLRGDSTSAVVSAGYTFGGSFLTKARRNLEQNLLESTLLSESSI